MQCVPNNFSALPHNTSLDSFGHLTREDDAQLADLHTSHPRLTSHLQSQPPTLTTAPPPPLPSPLPLQMPPVHFLLGVFSSPVLLGLLFTPLYLLHTDGLHFGEGAVSECPAAASSFTVAVHSCGAALHVFLYALSVSTTFGGSPVAAVSPFTLMVANLNVLCAQFLFVLLSGAGGRGES